MKKVLCLVFGGLVMASCGPSTPDGRIQKNPEMFARLSEKDQELVRQGVLAKGMHQDAVLLAWGAPSLRFEGYKDGKASERWDYTGSQPVYTSSFYGGYGGYGGRYGGRYGGYGFAPTVTYIPYCKSRVWFANHRVDAWERVH
ncbi:MAG: hypothetical protein K9N23_07380 [Akkermansiaceae bacterium]|nr:hypothetical protein [Akkermansiaceae bacterium]